MTVMIMLALGAGVGVGVILTAWSLVPVAPSLEEIVAGVERPGVPYRTDPVSASRSLRSILITVGKALSFGDEGELHKQLAIVGSTPEQHALVKAAVPSVVLLVSYLAWLLLLFAGLSLDPLIVTIGALCAAACAFVVPDMQLRRLATEARVGFRHALSAYLDLVTIIMAGGGGLLTALQTAADAGDGWAFAEIRAALDRARLTNRAPWLHLGELGERFDIAELRDLVAAAELAGSEGARIADSVATKADVLRSRLQADVERTAESMTEKMLLPVGLVLVALFLFLGFAVAQQLGGGGVEFEEQALTADLGPGRPSPVPEAGLP